MNEGTVHGERVSDERIQAWADEAEAGCDLRTTVFGTQGAQTVPRMVGPEMKGAGAERAERNCVKMRT